MKRFPRYDGRIHCAFPCLDFSAGGARGETGCGIARVNARNVNPEPCRLLVKRVGERNYEMFSRAIKCRAGYGKKRGDGANVKYAAAGFFKHERKKFSCKRNNGGNVYFLHRDYRIFGRFVEGADMPEPRIVYKNVNTVP